MSEKLRMVTMKGKSGITAELKDRKMFKRVERKCRLYQRNVSAKGRRRKLPRLSEACSSVGVSLRYSANTKNTV